MATVSPRSTPRRGSALATRFERESSPSRVSTERGAPLPPADDRRSRPAAEAALGDVQSGAGQPSRVFRTRCRIKDSDRRVPKPDAQMPDHHLPVSGAVLDGPGVEFGIRFQTRLLLDSRQVGFLDGLRSRDENGRAARIALVVEHPPVQQLVNRKRMGRTQKTAADPPPAFDGGAGAQQVVHFPRQPPGLQRVQPGGDEVATTHPFGGGASHSPLLLCSRFPSGPHASASRRRPDSEPLWVTEKGSFFSARS